MTTDRAKPSPRFHGRHPGRRPCSAGGCTERGEFRVPGTYRPSFDGPGDYRWMCLDHVRAYNAAYDYFSGMSADDVAAAHDPYGGWANETRAFAATGADAPPKWSDFRDPMDALGARFKHARQRAEDRAAGISPQRSVAYRTLGLAPGADRRAIRSAYSELVRKYHPDRNGGDRSFEKKLQSVVEAYKRLRET